MINKQDVIRALEDVVREVGGGYRLRDEGRRGFYFEVDWESDDLEATDHPHCILGHLFTRTEWISPRTLMNRNSTPIGELLLVSDAGFALQAIQALRLAQWESDKGTPWGEVLEMVKAS